MSFDRRVSFSQASFAKGASFSASFNAEVDFRWASFDWYADFRGTCFGDVVSFEGASFKAQAMFVNLRTTPRTLLSFVDAGIEKPEQFLLRTTHARSSWFIDVNAQNFDFEGFSKINHKDMPDFLQ